METDMLKPQYYNAVMAHTGYFHFLSCFLSRYIFLRLSVIASRQNLLGSTPILITNRFFYFSVFFILTFPLSGALAELNKIIPDIAATGLQILKLAEDAQGSTGSSAYQYQFVSAIYYFFDCYRIVTRPF